MFGGGFFRGFEDPLFSAHQQHMQSMMQPFDLMMPGHLGMQAITDGSGRQAGQQLGMPSHIQQGQMMPFQTMDPFGGMFGNMNNMMQSMMGNMNHMMPLMGQAQSPQNGHFYSQSSVMSYSNTGEGQPRVYQATSSTRQAPGGVRETRKTERDSESGLEKMAVGHHLDERGRVITRSRNTRTNDMNEDQDFINIDESEGGQFEHEWQSRAGPAGRGSHVGPSRHQRAVTDRYTPHQDTRGRHPGHHAQGRSRHTPAITYSQQSQHRPGR